MGFMSAFVKASAYALTKQPTVNAVIDGQEILYRDYVDISVAVATPKVSWQRILLRALFFKSYDPNFWLVSSFSYKLNSHCLQGLVVPVLRNVGDMTYADIEKGIAALGQKAKNNELAMEDMDGGTFTIRLGY